MKCLPWDSQITSVSVTEICSFCDVRRTSLVSEDLLIAIAESEALTSATGTHNPPLERCFQSHGDANLILVVRGSVIRERI